MSLAQVTARSAVWNLTTTVGGRVVTVIGTLVLIRYVAPGPYGEVIIASAVVFTASHLMNLGVGQYVVSQRSAGAEAVFHATACYVAVGLVVITLIVIFRGHLDALVDTPGMSHFIPGLALAAMIDRVAFMPERILIRDMRFRRFGIVRSVGEVMYTVVSLALAIAGWGGHAIVGGNVARSLVRGIGMTASADRRTWLSPCPPSRRVLSEIFAFAFPMWLGAAAGFAARGWDSLLVARLFGPAVTGLYSLGQSLAELPAVYIAEPVSDVLLPSFASTKPERRPAAFVHAVELLALIIFPMAIGLGVIAPPLAAALFTPQWQAIAPILMILSTISVARPIAGLVNSYLQTQNRPWVVLKLEWGLVAMLLVSIATIGQWGPLWVCAAAAASAAVIALASLFAVNRTDGVSIKRIAGVLWGPSAACAAMTVVVIGWRHAIGSALPVQLELIIEPAIGAATYAGAVFVFTPAPVRELFRLLGPALGLSGETLVSR